MAHNAIPLQKVPSHTRRTSSTLRSEARAPYLFLLPFVVLFTLFFIVPIIYAIYQSLFRSQRSGLGLGAATISFNGLGNYLDVVHDPNFYGSLGRVLLYLIVQVPVMLLLALALALLLDSAVVRLKAFFRVAFFVPFAIPGIIAALLWAFFYQPVFSPIDKAFQALGLPAPDFLGPGTVLWSIANIAVWTYAGYNMLIIFAALQAIPSEIYESARVDGATGWRVAWSIKIPLAAPALILTCIFSIVGALQLFTEPQVLSAISNNISTSYTPVFYAYTTAFSNNNYYFAAANPRTIVVVASGGPVLMPWLEQVPAVLESWYGGQEVGNALADILFGDVNPSGKLPVTFPRSDRETPVSEPSQYSRTESVAHLSEGLAVGYRGYDQFGIEPLFPFGYGLSYTSFAYSQFQVAPETIGGTRPLQVSFTLTNTSLSENWQECGRMEESRTGV